MGYPPHIGARVKKPAYGLNDAPRRWWNILDSALRSYGLVPTRADRCTYVYYGKQLPKSSPISENTFDLEGAVDYLMDPVCGNNAKNRQVHGALSLHVDDLLMTGDDVFEKEIKGRLRKDFEVGSEDKTDCLFVGQRIPWKHDDKHGWYINVHQNVAIYELQEITFDKHLKDDTPLTPQTHTEINWLQSRTQFHIGYQFSRCASKIQGIITNHEDVRAINKTVRTIKSIPLTQRAHVILRAEQRDLRQGSNSRGSLADYETHKINATTMSTSVAELRGLMRCYGSALFLRGLWSDITGEITDVHIRTDANNLVTTASTTHQPEQKETMHLIHMLRKESNSGQMHDLAHVRSEDCLADSLTKHSAKADELINAVLTGNLMNVDARPPFRTMLQNKAFLVEWLARNTKHGPNPTAFAGVGIAESMFAYWGTWA